MTPYLVMLCAALTIFYTATMVSAASIDLSTIQSERSLASDSKTLATDADATKLKVLAGGCRPAPTAEPTAIDPDGVYGPVFYNDDPYLPEAPAVPSDPLVPDVPDAPEDPAAPEEPSDPDSEDESPGP